MVDIKKESQRKDYFNGTFVSIYGSGSGKERDKPKYNPSKNAGKSLEVLVRVFI